MADAMKLLLEEARDLLLERRQGSPARSAAHNARLVIEDAIKLAASPPAREEAPGEGAGEAPEGRWVYTSACPKFEGDSNRVRAYSGSIHAGWEDTPEFETQKECYAWMKAECDRRNALEHTLRARTSEPAREAVAPFAEGGVGHTMLRRGYAYLEDYVLSTDGADYEPNEFERVLLEDFMNGLMSDEAMFGPVRTLLAHPAPATADKLRVAVEALEPFAADHECDGHATVSDYDLEVSLFVRYSKIVAARQALATLNEEG